MASCILNKSEETPVAGKDKFNRVSSVKVSFDDIVAGNYSTAHIMQLCRQAKVRATKKGVALDNLDSLHCEIVRQLSQCPNCPVCNRIFQTGEGKPINSSLSIHRLISGLGYTVGNVYAICNGCNKDIGEANTLADIERKRRAIAWQAHKMVDTGT
jgi:hypothetical protein